MAKECGCGEKSVIDHGVLRRGEHRSPCRPGRAYADRTSKVGSMTCLAALGAEESGYVESARRADRNVVIDGCPVSCGAKIYAKLGIPASNS